MRKPDFCLCENKDADQLHSNCKVDQRLCFRYTDGTIPYLLKSKISSFQPPSVAAQADLCETWSGRVEHENLFITSMPVHWVTRVTA